jgi:RimJ/RimL family protein N-acetyltransferase
MSAPIYWQDYVQPELLTQRFVLEPITEGHAKELCDPFIDQELHRYVHFESPTLEQQIEKCARWAKRRSPDGTELWLNWAARDKKTGLIAAHIQSGVKEDNTAYIGYVVSRKFQRNGVATECLQSVFDYLNRSLHVQEIKAWADTRNEASHRLAKRLGMIQIELIKNADFFKGSTSDEYVFSKKF